MQAEWDIVAAEKIPKLAVESILCCGVSFVVDVPEHIHSEDVDGVCRAQPEMALYAGVEFGAVETLCGVPLFIEECFQQVHRLQSVLDGNPYLGKLCSQQDVVGVVVHRQAPPHVVHEKLRLSLFGQRLKYVNDFRIEPEKHRPEHAEK